MIVQESRVSSDVKADARSTDFERWVARSTSHRERGLWSFLTWSFFLSQILAAQQFIGSAANAAEATGDSPASGDTSSVHTLIGSEPGPNNGEGQAVEEQGPAAEQSSPPSGLTGEALHLPLGADLQHALGLSLEPIDKLAHTGANFAALPEVTTIAAAAPTIGGGDTGDTGGSPDLIIPPVLETILPPVLDAVGDVVDTLNPLVEQTVSPVVATVGDLVETLNPLIESVAAPALGTVGEVAQTLEPVIDQIVSPVAATVGELAGALSPTIESVAAPVLDSVGDVARSLDSVIGQVAAPTLSIVGELAPTVASVTEPVVTPLLSSVAEVMGESDPLTSLVGLGSAGMAGAANAQDALASGGTVVLQELPVVSNIAVDDLFIGGGYTAYNLELQITVQTGTENASQGATVGVSESPMDNEIAIQGDHGSISSDQGDVQAHGLTIALPSILDEIALRGLGDGIS
jgi:hypothetical protein